MNALQHHPLIAPDFGERTRLVAGIMTGTSLDAIDVAICELGPDPGDGLPSCTLLAFGMVPYSADTLDLLEAFLGGTALTARDVSRLHTALANDYARAIQHVSDRWPVLDIVGMHGQTVWHEPPFHTLQLGSGPTLAALLQTAVVCDFRAQDVALGGQGAPLVPLFDLATLRQHTQTVVALNIGGMANISIIRPETTTETLVAFDTGPGNVLINLACRTTYGKQFDANGSIARAGRVLPPMLSTLQAHPFFMQDPPKSTGREVFNDDLMKAVLRRFDHPSLPSEDVVATVTELTAWSIVEHVQRYAADAGIVIASGGGAHNTYLMERLSALCAPITVVPSSRVGIDIDAKEAMCFAWLAWRRAAGYTTTAPSVTGARLASVSGALAVG